MQFSFAIKLLCLIYFPFKMNQLIVNVLIDFCSKLFAHFNTHTWSSKLLITSFRVCQFMRNGAKLRINHQQYKKTCVSIKCPIMTRITHSFSEKGKERRKKPCGIHFLPHTSNFLISLIFLNYSRKSLYMYASF